MLALGQPSFAEASEWLCYFEVLAKILIVCEQRCARFTPGAFLFYNGAMESKFIPLRVNPRTSADKIMNKTYIDKLAFIELRNRKVLETKSVGKDTWYIPGGKRDEGESDEQALVREIQEELNVEIDPSTISHYGTFEAQAHGKPDGTMVRMTCYQARYAGELLPSAEVEMMDWFNSAQKELTSPVDHLIFDDLKSKNLID